MFNISLWHYLKIMFSTNFAYLDDWPKFHFGQLSLPHFEFHSFYILLQLREPFDNKYFVLLIINGTFIKIT